MKSFLLYIFLSLTTFVAMADVGRTVSGIVVDNEGEPLPGASVKIDGKLTGTATDVDGRFSIPKITGAVKLVVTYIGFAPENVVVDDSVNEVRVVLSPADHEFDEIVVIGYGTAKKTSLTSSVETLSGDELLRIPAMNIDQSLSGQVAGLGVMTTTGDPSSPKEADLHIRGNTNPPLLVIDGVPRLGTNTSDGEMRLSDLNPDDIESISILKDAAAAAVYGARAANGVILVQTKRGKNDGRARVNYRGQFNLQEATYLPNFLNARQFAELYNRAVEATGSDVYTPYDLSLLDSDPNVYGDENMLDYLNQWGYSQRHSLSVSGGVKSVRYFISGGYTNTKGLYSNVGRDRYNYSAKLDADVAAGLSLSIDLSGSIVNNKTPGFTTLDAAYNFSPLQVLRFTDGNLTSIDGANPLVAVEGLGGYTKINSDYHTLNAVLRYDIPVVKGMQVYLKGTADMNHQNRTDFSKPVPLYLYDEKTGTTTVDPKTVYPKKKISMTDRWQRVNNKLIEIGVNYNRTFADKHDVTGLIVYNFQDYANKYLEGLNNNLAGPTPEIIGNTSSGRIVGSESFSQRQSVVGRATYGFDNRYFAEFSFRVDGSTRFSPENRWGFFPTVSASWVISNESFFKKIPPSVMSFAKLRASAGILGDDGYISDFSYLMNYVFSNNAGYPIGGVWAPGVMIDTNQFPNRNLKWGKSKDYNAGIDIGFLKNRISATIEVYQRTRSNMIMSAPQYLYPPSVGTGGNVPNINFGEVRYRGWDLSIKHVNTIGDFKYNVHFNIAKSYDKVLDYGDESNQLPNLRRKGGSYMVWSVYQAAGLFQSYEEIAEWPVDQDGMGNASLAPGDIKYIDIDENGVLSENDRTYVRNSSQPQLSYGLALGVQWKGLYMNAQFQGVSGYSQKINELYTLESRSLPRFQEYHYYDSWTPENPGASYPRVKFASSSDNNRRESTFWIKDCDFIRLKALTIGYRFASKLLKKANIQTLDIALQGGNLFTISSLENNMDPESLRGYPLQRTYGINLNFGF